MLGSATPSLEAIDNVRRGRYRRLELPHRAGGASPPRIDVVDLRSRPFDSGLCDVLVEALEGTKARSEQALLFINRRGYAPVLMCHACGWVADCDRCDARLVFHREDERMHCHHCAAVRVPVEACPTCGSKNVRRLGLGTERVARALERRIKGLRVARMDRDATRRRGALEALLDRVHAGEVDAVVGTQMLAKGHHFPNVTLVAILDADAGLFGIDFRATERMAQLLLQVAGRAGRGHRTGRVLLQTHNPEHPLLRVLVLQGYRQFCAEALEERRGARLPPFASLALVRAEALERDAPQSFLRDAEARAKARPHPGFRCWARCPRRWNAGPDATARSSWLTPRRAARCSGFCPDGSRSWSPFRRRAGCGGPSTSIRRRWPDSVPTRTCFGGQRFYTFADAVRSHASAARMYLDCRREGVTVRSTVDCLVAQCAIESELVLLHHDMDFRRIARVVPSLKEKSFLD